jgi:tRNA/tmRNA/rRNA uracil-C5-methylase (TrmA/RlmC/RlmD family)
VLAADAGLAATTVVTGPPFAWRHRARLAVRGRATSPKVGIFQEGTHRIVDIPQCLVHHPRINVVAAAAKAAIRATGVAPYADAPHRGLVRYLQVVVERPTGRAQVVVVANADDPASTRAFTTALAEAVGGDLHSLWWNGNPERTNVILGSRWERLAGEDMLCETIGGAEVFFPPGAFGQANLPLADRMAEQVSAWVPDGVTVAELYAGCGALGLGLARRVARITFNEAAPAAVAGLERGIAALPVSDRVRAAVRPGPAAGALAALDGADVVIVDPPRRGVDAAVLQRLIAAPPQRLVAVSCNLDAFLREAAMYLAAGLVLRALVPFALFPHTDHVETVAVFERS